MLRRDDLSDGGRFLEGIQVLTSRNAGIYPTGVDFLTRPCTACSPNLQNVAVRLADRFLKHTSAIDILQKYQNQPSPNCTLLIGFHRQKISESFVIRAV